MDKKTLLDRVTQDEDTRVLLSRVLDRAEAAQRRQIPTSTAFLSPREQILSEQLIRAWGSTDYVSLGGYPEAERRILVFLPDWMERDSVEPGEYLALLRCTWHAEDGLTHRDFLGALMGMGVARDTLGDILVVPGSCDLVVLPTVAGFLRDSLTGAGRVHFHGVEQLPLTDIQVPEQKRKTLRDTVSALRLDSVLSVGFSVSRSRAAQYIEAGRCAVNWQETDKPSLAVKEGDVISCRGLGKCQLTQVGGLSRKGRINITVERYL